MRDDGEVGGERRYVAPAVLALVTLLAAPIAGCGTASPETAPTGIDQLVVPTPSPDPADYVRAIDNPWLPYVAGASWTYRVTGGASRAADGTTRVTVLDAGETVAGVATTAVERTDQDGVAVVDLFAQDVAGNVWWFGRDGEWRAGESGAQAGLAMPAAPRLGDGWRAAHVPGVLDVLASVAATDESASTPAGRFTDLVTLELDGLPEEGATGTATRASYARGVGLVVEVATEGPATVVELVEAPD